MLVLSRKRGERIRIGGSVVLTVSAMRGGQVRLAFEAPREVAIVREELEDGRREIIPPRRWTSKAE
jgi:carbon storage regulator